MARRSFTSSHDLHIASNRRIRCAGHIINLTSKALIYSSGVSNFESELAKASPEDQYAMFRARGAIGKLHNFVNAVYNSPKRRRLFQSIQRTVLDEDKLFSFSTLNLVRNGGIRWHSVYLMLPRCLELRDTPSDDFSSSPAPTAPPWIQNTILYLTRCQTTNRTKSGS
ncbi:transposase-like protein [Paraphaeosphaeria sporulosa]